MEVISREEARKQGLNKYFTNKPCKRGHISERYVSIQACIECHNEHMKKYYKEKPEYFKASNKRYQENHKDKIKIYLQEWYLKNPGYLKNYIANKLANDKQYKMGVNIRQKLRYVVKGNLKRGKAVREIGCSSEFLRNYIENKFSGEMTWENYGKIWEFDHIKPLSKFNLEDRSEYVKATHYTNIQPLKVNDSRVKKNNYREEI
jgi:hypothetical protein